MNDRSQQGFFYLSPPRKEVFDAVVAIWAETGLPPTQEEIARRIGKGQTSVRDQLDRLIEEGYLASGGRGARRSIRVLKRYPPE